MLTSIQLLPRWRSSIIHGPVVLTVTVDLNNWDGRSGWDIIDRHYT